MIVDFTNQTVVLVDDVLKSGKTLMYGAQYFMQKPLKKLTTAILIDRNYKRYPIKADVVGLSLSTTMQEHVSVELGNKGGCLPAIVFYYLLKYQLKDLLDTMNRQELAPKEHVDESKNELEHYQE